VNNGLRYVAKYCLRYVGNYWLRYVVNYWLWYVVKYCLRHSKSSCLVASSWIQRRICNSYDHSFIWQSIGQVIQIHTDLERGQEFANTSVWPICHVHPKILTVECGWEYMFSHWISFFPIVSTTFPHYCFRIHTSNRSKHVIIWSFEYV